MVYDWEVWSHLIRGVTKFSEERLDQLVEFGDYGSQRFGIDSSPEMMMEVVKEVASRCQKDLHLYWADTVEERRRRRDAPTGGFLGSSKITVSFEGGWGAPCTFEVAGESYRQELNRVAQAVGVKFTIKKLHFGGNWYSAFQLRGHQKEILGMIAAQVGQQGEEGLSKLEFDTAALMSNREVGNIVFSLIEASKEWTMQHVTVQLQQDGLSEKWTELIKSSAKGHIGKFSFYCPPLFKYDGLARPQKKNVKAVWEISEVVTVTSLKANYPAIGGGRGKDPKISWEEAYETLLKVICTFPSM